MQKFTVKLLFQVELVGSLYGMPVVVHNGLSAQQYFMAEKSGLAYGFQMGQATLSKWLTSLVLKLSVLFLINCLS